MDNFEQLMNEGKMNHEPSPDFVDNVMDRIESETHVDAPLSSVRRTRMYKMMTIAACFIAVVVAVGVLTNSSGKSSSGRRVAINSSTTTPTIPTTSSPSNQDPEAKAVADEFDVALGTIDSDLSSDAKNTFDTSKLNDDGI